MNGIKKDFGSLDSLQKQLSAAAVGVQGSGWAWLGYNKGTQRLQIATCANQDPLQATTGKQSSFLFLLSFICDHTQILKYRLTILL